MSMKLISTTTLSTSAASITFSSIPGTYTDLMVLASVRCDDAADVEGLVIKPNGQTSNLSFRALYGNGSTAASGTASYARGGLINGNNSTSNTFSNNLIYIPNYSGSTNKSFFADGVNERNATQAYQELLANLWSDTTAITSLEFVQQTPSNFLSGSTISLYGITKGSDGVTTAS